MILFKQKDMFRLSFCGRFALEGREILRLARGGIFNCGRRMLGRRGCEEGGNGGDRHGYGAFAVLVDIALSYPYLKSVGRAVSPRLWVMLGV